MVSSRRRPRFTLVAVLTAALVAVPVAAASANPDGVGRSSAYAYGSVDADGHRVSANVASGNLTFTETDVLLPNTEDLWFSRTYNSLLSGTRRDVGFGWTTNAGYDVRLTVSGSNLQLVDATGHRVDFTADGSGGYTSSNESYAAETLPGGGWEITVPPPGGTLMFNGQGLLTATTTGDDVLGYTYTSAGGQDRLSSIVDPGTTNTRPSYNGDGSIIEIDDPASQHYYYGYNAAKQLTSYSGPGPVSATYGYDTGGRLNAISWSDGASTAVTYDASGRVTLIVGTSADSSVDSTAFEYSTSVTGCPALSVGTTVVTNSAGEGATYCWRADFVITKITPIDTVAPDASAAGDLVDASNHYAPLDSDQTITLLGSDDRSGIRQLRLDVNGTTVATADADCNEGQLGVACPMAFDAEVEYDPSSLLPGEHTFTAVAVDDAGNIGPSESWTVTIDRTAPSESDTLTAYYDVVEGNTWIQWSGDEDPDSSSAPGAGMGSWRYRYKRNSGSWSTYREVNEPNATLTGGDEGDVIKVQVTPSDRAGNAADETEVETVALSSEDLDEDLPSASSARSARATTRSLGEIFDDGISCTPKNADTDLRFLSSYASQAFIAIEASATMQCAPAVGLPLAALTGILLQRISFMACPVQDGDPLTCDRKKFAITKTLGTGRDFHSKGLAICNAGTNEYRVYFHSKHFDQANIRGNTETFNCNEAGAWRRIATRNGKPSTILGDNMPNGYNSPADPSNPNDDQAIPANGTSGPRRGWAAHHIILSNSKDELVRDAQAAGYACNIPPNGAVNGVWLRGVPLRYSSNRSAPYWNLTPSQRRRDYHPSVHTDRYLTDVSAAVRPFANSNGTCKPNGQQGIATALRDLLRKRLRNGAYTEGV